MEKNVAGIMEHEVKGLRHGFKKISICMIVTGILFCMEANAQVSIKTEYIGNSDYMYTRNDGDDEDEKAEKVGDSQGSAWIHSFNANIPFYMKMNENNRPTVWGVGVDGAFALLDNKNFEGDMVSEIMNLQLGIFHLRPLNDKWSMMANIGAGVFTPFMDFSKIRGKHILGSAGIIFIRHLLPNLDIGGGAALNTSLGYPMVFPSFYLDWRLEGKFNVNVSLSQGLEVSAGYTINDYLGLSLVGTMNGQTALLEKDGEKIMFTHQYIVTGLRPEIKFGKTGISLTAMGGINAVRPTAYNELSLKGMFAEGDDYFFRVSPYASFEIRYGF